MLSEEEKRDLKAMARSRRVRAEFDTIRSSGQRYFSELTVDQLLGFLNGLSRLQVSPLPPEPFLLYTNMRL